MPTRTNRPPVLYKYRALNDRTKELLTTRTLYFPSIKEINDPFDCRVLLERNATRRRLWKWLQKKLSAQYKTTDPVQMVYKWFSSPNHLGPSFTEEHAREFIRKKRWRELDPNNLTGYGLIMNAREANIRMYCFSATNDEILMWSHYAENHHGICLGFDMDSNPVFEKTAKVNYVRRYPHADYYRVTDQQYYEYSLLTKSDRWRYEKEWRLMLPNMPEGRKAIHTFKTEFLKTLVFGCQTTDSEKDLVRSWLKAGGLSPDQYVAVPSDSEYSLLLRPVS